MWLLTEALLVDMNPCKRKLQRIPSVLLSQRRQCTSSTVDPDQPKYDVYGFEVAGSRLQVSEGSYSGISSGGAWASRSVFALLRHLEANEKLDVAGSSVLELGAGSGVLAAGS